MPSTVIRRFTYSPDSEELTIEFVTGRRYVYSAVPEEEVQAMREAFSKGVYFNKHIRDRYAYRELV
jgi:lysyl-tRNA synthetase class 2